MKNFKVLYFTTDSGRAPVQEFIEGLDNRSQRKIVEIVGLLEGLGASLGAPHAKYIGDDIYELRVCGIEGQIRVLYFFVVDDNVILVNGFIKKTWEVPRKEIDVAQQRRKAYLERHKSRG